MSSLAKIANNLTSLKRVSFGSVKVADGSSYEDSLSAMAKSLPTSSVTFLELSTSSLSVASIVALLQKCSKSLIHLVLRFSERDEAIADVLASLRNLRRLELELAPEEADSKIDLKWLKSVPTSVEHLRLTGKLTERVARHLRTQIPHLKRVELDYEFWASKFAVVRAKELTSAKFREVVAENLPSTADCSLISDSAIFGAVETAGVRGAPKFLSEFDAFQLASSLSYTHAGILLFRFGKRAWRTASEPQNMNFWTCPERLDRSGLNLFHLATSFSLGDPEARAQLFSTNSLQESYSRDRRCFRDCLGRNPIMLAAYDPEGIDPQENLALFKTVAHELTQANFLSLNDQDASGDTVLHHVIRGSSSETLGVKLSILGALGIDWNITNDHGQTAAHIATTEALQELLWAKSPDLHQELDLNWPFKNALLFRACAENLLSVVSLLLLPQFSSWIDWECTVPKGRSESWLKANCVEVGQTFLQVACDNSSAAVIRLLLGAYAGKRSIIDFYSSVPDDRAPLFLVSTAARRRTKLIVPDDNPSKLPQFVYEANDVRKISLLVESGFTASSDLVFHALVGSDGDVSKCVVQPELDAPTINRTLRQLFLTQRDSKLIDFIISLASVEALNFPDETDKSRTILHQFAEFAPADTRSEEIIKLLVSKGALLSLLDSDGSNAMAALSKKKLSPSMSTLIQEAARLQQSQNPQARGSCITM